MVLEETKVAPTFSIERLESVMYSQGITWEQINNELECDAETLLKSKKSPMQNVINKVCSAVGMKNSDYVMMKSSSYKIVKDNPVIDEDKNTIPSSFIDAEILNLYIKESDWSYQTISSLMSTKSVFKFNGYVKRASVINKDDLDTLCWALVIKKNDICNVTLEDGYCVPARKIFGRQKYILSYDLINELSKQMDDICKVAHIPAWFVYYPNDIYVSLEMAEILLDAINKVTERNITLYELCTNYDGTTVNKREYNTKKKESVSIEDSIRDTCNMLTNIIYKSDIPVHDVGYDISKCWRYILQAEDYYYIRRDDLCYLKSMYLDNLDISIVALVHRLIESGICNSFKEGVRTVPTRKLNGYGGTRFIEINKDKLFSTANNYESGMLYGCNASEKERIRTKMNKEQEEKNGGDKEGQRFYKVSDRNHTNRYRSNNSTNYNNKCLEVFSKIDHLSNSDLDKVIDYINTIRKLRDIRNSVK